MYFHCLKCTWFHWESQNQTITAVFVWGVNLVHRCSVLQDFVKSHYVFDTIGYWRSSLSITVFHTVQGPFLVS